jgi:hypothetical protein
MNSCAEYYVTRANADQLPYRSVVGQFESVAIEVAETPVLRELDTS